MMKLICSIINRSNLNRKYWNFWPSLAFNIASEKLLFKFIFPCIEVFLSTKDKEQINVVTLLILLQEIILVSFELFCPSYSITTHRIKTNCENKNISWEAFLNILLQPIWNILWFIWIVLKHLKKLLRNVLLSLR